MFGTDIGIDLGTATVLIYERKHGVVLREPSVVAVDQDTGNILAVGYEAKNMVGRTPGSIVSAILYGPVPIAISSKWSLFSSGTIASFI